MNPPEFSELPTVAPVGDGSAARRSLALVIGLLVLGAFAFGLVLGAGPGSAPPTPAGPVVPAAANAAAEDASPSASPSPVGTTSPTMPTPAPTPSATPPSGLLPLDRALAALDRSGFGVRAADIVAARLMLLADVDPGPASVSTDWVWAFTVRGSFPPMSCGGVRLGTPGPCPSPATSELVVLDARSGTLLFGTSPGR